MDLLKTKKIIIIGGNAAGPSAAAKAKRTDPSADVKLFEAGNFISTGTCELPYLLAGEIKDYKDLVFFSPETFQSEKGVAVYINHVVKSINRKKKKITVTKLEDKSVKEYEYDKLILTTGAVAKNLPVFSGEFENVLTLKSVGDYLKIKSRIEKTSVKNVAIIGAGYIGIETAESFKELGYNVAIIDKSDVPMPALDKETSLLIFDVLKKNDVKFYGGVADFSIVKNGNRITEIKFGENNIETDLILSAVGFRPNNNLGIGANLKTGGFGGLVVDKRLRTSDPDIFAAGDNIEVINKITGTQDYIPLATIAHEFGHIAGENAAGGDAFSNSIVKNISVKVFDKVLSTVGLNFAEAEKVGFFVNSVHAVVPNLVKVMPESKKVFGKIIFDKHSGKLLGAQFLGNNEVIGYADLVSMMINNSISAKELAKINYNYTPPYSPFINILSVLGRKIEKGA